MKTSLLANLKCTAWGIVTAALLLPGLAVAHKDATTASLAFSPSNPVSAGTAVTITGTYLYTGGFDNGNCQNDCDHAKTPGSPVVGQSLQIEMLQTQVGLATDPQPYNPTIGISCGSTGVFVQVPPVNTPTDGNGQVSNPFDTTGLGGKSICFRAHAPGSGGNHGVSGAHSAGINLVIQDGVCTGVTLANPSVSGGTTNPNGSVKGPWTISMTLKNCLAARDFKVQGGATSWAPYKDGSASVTAGALDYKVNKKNTVIIWNVNAGEETITFTVGSASTVIPCGGIDGITQYLSGEWSAAYKDDNNQPAKSDYTARATVSSLACQ
jgi:hypothetical protein